MHQGISADTRISSYADDTKIWGINYKKTRKILHNCRGQKDINILYLRPLNNKMKFHPDKCKVVTIAAKLPSFWVGGGSSHALLLPSFLDLALPTLLFALSFDLLALPFGYSELYLLSTVFYCAFSQIIHRKVYLGLAKIPVTFFLVITNKPEFMLTFLHLGLIISQIIPSKEYLGLAFSEIILDKVYLGLNLKLYLARCISD